MTAIPTKAYLHRITISDRDYTWKNTRPTNSRGEEEYLLCHSRDAGMEPLTLTTEAWKNQLAKLGKLTKEMTHRMKRRSRKRMQPATKLQTDRSLYEQVWANFGVWPLNGLTTSGFFHLNQKRPYEYSQCSGDDKWWTNDVQRTRTMNKLMICWGYPSTSRMNG